MILTVGLTLMLRKPICRLFSETYECIVKLLPLSRLLLAEFCLRHNGEEGFRPADEGEHQDRQQCQVSTYL